MQKVTLGLLIGGIALVATIGLAAWASLPAPPPKPSGLVLAKSTVSANSTPLFLSTTQTPVDTLPWNVPGVQASSSRYQGTIEGTRFYLAVSDSGQVEIIRSSGKNSYSYGSGSGNSVMGAGLPDGGLIQYIPQGATTHTLKGWVPFSQFMIIRS